MSETMKSITDILDWKLLSGSHEWPGPEGGTCINEAAIVVAGLKYRSVGGVNDLPSCFSPVIGAYLIKLNDDMTDASRQRLIEFAPRLSGSADTPEIEQQRWEYIVVETVKRIVSSALDAAGLASEADQCRSVKTFGEAKVMAARAARAAGAAIDDACIEIVRGALAIGNQAPPIEVALIKKRAARARELATTE